MYKFSGEKKKHLANILNVLLVCQTSFKQDRKPRCYVSSKVRTTDRLSGVGVELIAQLKNSLSTPPETKTKKTFSISSLIPVYANEVIHSVFGTIFRDFLVQSETQRCNSDCSSPFQSGPLVMFEIGGNFKPVSHNLAATKSESVENFSGKTFLSF